MDNEKMGRFIAGLRKSKQMTQKDLADRLHITDKAVSKWERGLSCPDISLLSMLASLLGITTGELLKGERADDGSLNVENNIDNALQYADRAVKSKARTLQSVCALAFSFLLLAGIVVCVICDLAFSGGFTWSLFPISSIVFGWLVVFPVLKFGVKGIWGSLLAVSVFILPFLLVLDRLIPSDGLILSIGIWTSAISLVFLWIVFALFQFLRTRKWVAAAVSLLLGIPLCLCINGSLSAMIAAPLVDVWDGMTFAILIAGAIVFFFADRVARKRKTAP